MRIRTLASLLALSLLFSASPAFAQKPEEEIIPGANEDAEQPEKTEGVSDDLAEEADDSDGDEDDSEDTPPKAKKKATRSLAAEGEETDEEVEADSAERELEAAEAETDEVIVEKQVVTRTEVRSIDDSRVDSAWNAQLDEMSQRYRWRLFVGGYIRAQYTGIQNDAGNGLIGQNDGFILGNARLTLQGSMRDTLGFRLQFDGAVDRNTSPNTGSGEVVTRLKDAYIFWNAFDFLGVKFGQFKPPYDVEEIFSTSEILFVDRSVGSRGVQGVEGFNQPGLSIQREVGLEFGTPGYFPFASGDEPEGFGVSYGIAMTNGETANRTLNDNDQLAYYGRLGLHWGDLVRVGGAYFVNNSLVGEQPDVIEEDRSGFTADLTFTGFGVTAVASYIQNTTATPDVDVNPEEVGTAYQASLAYKEPFFGFQPAVRYAYYDPTDALENDALTYITVGVNYLPDYPIRLTVNYTLTGEEEGRELNNNRFDTMLQVEW